MARYMVVEHFRQGNSAAVYARFAQKGRMLPEGLRYIDSWLGADDATCWQVMETDRPETFDSWTRNWDDLAEFEIMELKDKPTGR